MFSGLFCVILEARGESASEQASLGKCAWRILLLAELLYFLPHWRFQDDELCAFTDAKRAKDKFIRPLVAFRRRAELFLVHKNAPLVHKIK